MEVLPLHPKELGAKPFDIDTDSPRAWGKQDGSQALCMAHANT